MKLISLLILHLFMAEAYAQNAHQLFDTTKMSYPGNKIEQAQLLLREVAFGGDISNVKPDIDSMFLKLIDDKISITKEMLASFLTRSNIMAQTIGGSPYKKVSHIDFKGIDIYVKYFVIHDVSYPEIQDSFPGNINDSSFIYKNTYWNKVDPWKNIDCHALITRTGDVKLFHDFSEGWRATKFEGKFGLGPISKGLFLHIELVQPRVYPPGKKGNAKKAPTPGFTDIQYQRLALLYVSASVRKGDWLIPAFHGCIDEHMKILNEKGESIEDNHDDPQNFEIKKFISEVFKIVSSINNMQ